MPTGNTGNRRNTELVFTTDTGRVDAPREADAGRQGGHDLVRVELSRSGRKGKTVTVVTGLPPADLRAMAKELKRLCGAGGSAKEGAVEIQGDHRERIKAHLASRYRVS